RTAFPLTLFYTTDTGFMRISPTARTAVARPQGPTLKAITTEVTMRLGEMAQIPVEIVNAGDLKEISLNANICSNGVQASWGTPVSLAIQDGKAQFPLQIPDGVTQGDYVLVIARSWRSDIRVGMPGPCTAAIKLTVVPK